MPVQVQVYPVWQSWIGNTTTAATTVDYVWQAWYAGTATGTTSSMLATNVWDGWNAAVPYAPAYRTTVMTYQMVPLDEPAPALTPAEVAPAARRVALNARRRVRAERRREAEQRRAARRADELLRSILTPEQYAAYHDPAVESFEVVGSDGGRYRIQNRGVMGNVVRLDEAGDVIERLCVHPQRGEWLPHADVHAAQKLAVEADEADFRARANISRIPPVQRWENEGAVLIDAMERLAATG